MSAEISPTPIDLAREADFELGGVAVRPSLRELGAGGDTLEPRVMRVLIALAQRLDRVVSRDELIETCWDGRIVGDDAINACIAKVRRAGEAHRAFQIETVPRVGYRMRLPTPEGAAARAPRRLALRIAAIAVAGLAIALGGWFAYDRWAEDQALRDPRLAVAPFKALSDDPAARAFVKAADTEIAGALNEGRMQTTAGGIGRAALVVGGSVNASADRLHVRVSLTDRRAGVILWSAEFDRAQAAAAGLPTDIARRTASVAENALMLRRKAGGSVDPETLALMVKAYDGIGLAGGTSADQSAEVVRRAPRFGVARAVRAMGLVSQAVFAPPQQFEGLRSQAVAEANEALRLDPNVSLAHGALAAATDGRQWTEREAALLRGRAGDDPVVANGGLVAFLASVGRVGEAARLGKQLAQGNRTLPAVSADIDYALYLAGGVDEARAFLARDLAVRPNDTLLHGVELQVAAFGGPPDEALAVLAEATRGASGLNPGTVEPFRAFLAARKTNTKADRETAVVAIMDAANATRLLRSHAIPMLVELGAVDEAFQLADIYVHDPIPLRLGRAMNSAFLFGPDTARMRRDPRFIDLMKALRLVDYWRASNVWPDFCATERQSVCAQMRAEAGV